jgi:hypothetical protein
MKINEPSHASGLTPTRSLNALRSWVPSKLVVFRCQTRFKPEKKGHQRVSGGPVFTCIASRHGCLGGFGYPRVPARSKGCLGRLATSALCGAEIQIGATSTTTRTTSPVGLQKGLAPHNDWEEPGTFKGVPFCGSWPASVDADENSSFSRWRRREEREGFPSLSRSEINHFYYYICC